MVSAPKITNFPRVGLTTSFHSKRIACPLRGGGFSPRRFPLATASHKRKRDKAKDYLFGISRASAPLKDTFCDAPGEKQGPVPYHIYVLEEKPIAATRSCHIVSFLPCPLWRQSESLKSEAILIMARERNRVAAAIEMLLYA